MVTEYPVVGEGSENGLDVDIDENNNAHFYAYLEYSPFKVTYKYLEECTDKELKEPIVEPIMSYMLDSDQSKTSVEIDGYEFVSAKGDLNLKREEVEPFITEEEIENGAQEIIYYFKSTSEVVDPSEKPDDTDKDNETEEKRTFNVYFYYVDVFTGEYIATPETMTLNYNDGYCLDSPYKIETYELIYSDYYYGTCESEDDIVVYSFYLNTKQPIGMINGKDEVINVYYKKIKPNPDKKNKYNVTINYLDENGNKIYKSLTTLLKEEGSYYDVTDFNAIEIDGYTYERTNGDDLRGVLDKNKEVNVIYKKYDPNIVKTSDNNNLFVRIAIGALAIVLLVFITRKSKK